MESITNYYNSKNIEVMKTPPIYLGRGKVIEGKLASSLTGTKLPTRKRCYFFTHDLLTNSVVTPITLFTE